MVVETVKDMLWIQLEVGEVKKVEGKIRYKEEEQNMNQLLEAS